jgi:hypothetical protein
MPGKLLFKHSDRHGDVLLPLASMFGPQKEELERDLHRQIHQNTTSLFLRAVEVISGRSSTRCSTTWWITSRRRNLLSFASAGVSYVL